MLASFKVLFGNDYNKKHILFALKRFVQWKIIKLFKLRGVHYELWGDKKLMLNYDSFQSMWVMYNYIVDWEEFNLISRLLHSSDHVCDIGANMGVYTIWMSKFIGSTGAIHSFEPDRINFLRLSRNVNLNNLQPVVHLNSIAVSEQNGDINFTTKLDEENHIVINNTGNSTVTEAKKLDTYIKENNIPFLKYVKIDVEGFEYFVLKGAEDLLRSRKIMLLQLEINQALSYSNISVTEIIDLLALHDYQLCRYDVRLNRLFPVVYTPSKENYFAVYDIDGINDQLKLN